MIGWCLRKLQKSSSSIPLPFDDPPPWSSSDLRRRIRRRRRRRLRLCSATQRRRSGPSTASSCPPSRACSRLPPKPPMSTPLPYSPARPAVIPTSARLPLRRLGRRWSRNSAIGWSLLGSRRLGPPGKRRRRGGPGISVGGGVVGSHREVPSSFLFDFAKRLRD